MSKYTIRDLKVSKTRFIRARNTLIDGEGQIKEILREMGENDRALSVICEALRVLTGAHW